MKHILAVDDNPANLTLVRETLKDSYKVTVVTSGEQAVRFLDMKKPDLILLDMCMPGMDGLETLRKINRFAEKPWKVVFLTALAEQGLVVEARALGAIDCIPKPFNPKEMKSRIFEILGE